VPSRSMMDLKNGNRQWLAIVLLSGVATVGALLGVLIALFLMHSNQGGRVTAPMARQIQSDLETESGGISPPPGDISIRHGALPGLVKTYYKSGLNYERIKAHYSEVLAAHGWKFLREDQVKYDGSDYGGKQFIYCKGTYAADVQYAGQQESQFGWTYSFALSSGLFECK